jgi:hypothetical protein
MFVISLRGRCSSNPDHRDADLPMSGFWMHHSKQSFDVLIAAIRGVRAFGWNLTFLNLPALRVNDVVVHVPL